MRHATSRRPSRFWWVLLCLPVILVASTLAVADDWPWWRGPTHDGISAETNWSPAAVAKGKVLWRAEVGKGHSSFAVAGGKAYTLGNKEGQDIVYCFDAETGAEVWTTSYACAAGNYPGPRATPTVDGAFVYTVSREGHLHCLDAASGEVKWMTKMDTQLPRWGLASSPIVAGNLIVVNATASGAAFDKKTGKVVWSDKPGTPGYASPVPIKMRSKVGFLLFSQKSLVCVNGKTGKPLWSHPWTTKYDVNAADPVLVGKDHVFISSGYRTGCAMLKASSRGVSKVWQNKNMSNHVGSCLLHEGHLYGSDDTKLACIDVKRGDTQWSQSGLGKGGMTLSDGKLIILAENGGALVIAAADPKAYVELARAQVLDGHSWTPPVLANGRIYCRNDAGSIACVDARGE